MRALQPLKRQPVGDARADMTPMLDMVFILLIFFIVTATFVSEPGTMINRLTGDAPSNPDKPKTLEMRLNADNGIELNGYSASLGAVTPVVTRFITEEPDGSVLILLHDHAEHGYFIALHDAARRAGLSAHEIAVKSVHN